MGIGSMSGRCSLTSSTIGNTVYGRNSLQVADGATYNTVAGLILVIRLLPEIIMLL